MELNKITKSYDGRMVLDRFSLAVENGRTVCLFGESGCGKTTILNIISGLTEIDSGEVKGTKGKRISYLFQEDRLLESATAEENIMLSTKNMELSKKIIEVCDISDYLNLYPSQMSGGMKRRVAIARAVAFDGEIVLLDEPFNGIDTKRVEKAADFLREFLMSKICIVVSHSLNDAELLSAQVFNLNKNI
ncbi:MAG: ATP-binding cassette domain-containing protein [Candidatus Metalachnospira sp.]|nr:ATP-binding cassette domain-containing protein [Candidatus Metalachnospira sp.]